MDKAYKRIADLNPDYSIRHIEDTAFKKYGRVIKSIECAALEKYIMALPDPVGTSIYVRSDAELAALGLEGNFRNHVCGGMDVDLGYALGHSQGPVQRLEYHRCNEALVYVGNAAVKGVGDLRDVENGEYDIRKMEFFYVPAGTILDVFQTTLHGEAYQTSEAGYRILMALAKGTNGPLDFPVNRRVNPNLAARNSYVFTYQEHLPCEGYVRLKGSLPEFRC